MRRFIILFLLFFTGLVDGHRIELRYGRVINTKKIDYRDDKIIFDGGEIARDSVRRIVFEEEERGAKKLEISSDVKKILRDSERARKIFPNAQGIVLLDDGINIFHKDSTRTYRYHFQGLILSNETMSWARFSLYFNDELENVRIIMARTIKPDGRTIEVNPRNFKISKPRSQFVYFQQGKTLTFNFPEVSPGDIVEYIYEVHIFNPWNKAVFTPGWFFGGEQPVYYSHYKIVLPRGMKLNYKLLNAAMVKKKITETDSCVIYDFTAWKVEPFVKEPLMPPAVDILPRLVSSNLESWDYLFDWYANFQVRRMQITPKIKALADSLVKDAKSEDDSIARIYYWVQQKIRYISIKGGASSGVSGHPAEVTLENGFGDCTDKSILFSTLLRAIGIKAYPVYINTNDAGMLVKEIPSFYGNHAITEIIKRDGTKLFLDATGYYSRYPSFWSADHGVYAINAQLKRIEFIPVPPPEQNMRNYKYTLSIDTTGGIYVKFHSTYTGYYETGLRYFWNSKKEEERNVIMNSMVKRVHPNTRLIKYELKNLNNLFEPFEMLIEYRIDNYLERSGDLLIFKLPEIEERYTFPELSLERRQYDLVYETSQGIRNYMEITFPISMKLVFVPDSVNLNGKHASYSARFSVQGNTINFEDTFRRWDRIIPVDDYRDYKDEIESLQSFIKQPILFEGGKQ